ncbi:hypothetical protein B0H10DRAFT_2437575 [Mycena sp. CBHHK59/15]|nr:hypothetical protein B0H10DRAFT_2437575 [Mycena sp. CBHHK59/15]
MSPRKPQGSRRPGGTAKAATTAAKKSSKAAKDRQAGKRKVAAMSPTRTSTLPQTKTARADALHLHLRYDNLLRLSTLAAATPVGRSDIQCPDTDKDGSALTGSAGSGDFVTCTYTDAGPCTYFSADGSFSSGSSTCPKGIAQDPSVTPAHLGPRQRLPRPPRRPPFLHRHRRAKPPRRQARAAGSSRCSWACGRPSDSER